MIPLGLTARNLMEEASALRRSQEHVAHWLGGNTDLRVSDLDVDGKRAMVTVRGSGDAPPPGPLRDVLGEDLGSDTVLEIRAVSEELVVVGEADGDRNGNVTVTD